MAAATALLSAFLGTPPAQAQSFRVLYTFTGGTDGGNSYGSLIRDKAGNLYGTAKNGGHLCKFGLRIDTCGVIFKVDSTGAQTVLHAFVGTDGAFPTAGLVQDTAGNFYGTTPYGGDVQCPINFGCGVVFKLDSTGRAFVLSKFTGGTDGANPAGGLVLDSAGNLFGMTRGGGQWGWGTVFKRSQVGVTVLYSFSGGTDGGAPLNLIRDADGNFYGTTNWGGDPSCFGGCGVVFKLDPTGKETVLHSFTGQADGAYPFALVLDPAGNLYGTAYEGGDFACNAYGCGVVFKLDTHGMETVLHTFAGGTDGKFPGGLTRDDAGNLYGTTEGGGRPGCPECGTIFKLDLKGNKTVLYSFQGGAKGFTPAAHLLRTKTGNFYGTTSLGGIHGYGVVYKLKP